MYLCLPLRRGQDHPREFKIGMRAVVVRLCTIPWFKQATSMDKIRSPVIRMVKLHVMLDLVNDDNQLFPHQA